MGQVYIFYPRLIPRPIQTPLHELEYTTMPPYENIQKCNQCGEVARKLLIDGDYWGWQCGCNRYVETEEENARIAAAMAEIRRRHGFDQVCGDDPGEEAALRERRTHGRMESGAKLGPMVERSVSPATPRRFNEERQ